MATKAHSVLLPVILLTPRTHNWIRTNDFRFNKTDTLPLSYMRWLPCRELNPDLLGENQLS